MEPNTWQEAATSLYHTVSSEILERWRGKPVEGRLEYSLDDMKEALLDLKQAVIDDQPEQAARVTKEILILQEELRRRPPE